MVINGRQWDASDLQELGLDGKTERLVPKDPAPVIDGAFIDCFISCFIVPRSIDAVGLRFIFL